ncbi:hypothetical protein PVAND_005446 [Polypedilum vanderplanki]|uniref:Lipase domain-containing protein n=1 Tax=Polypedilum vanderplanki TaxID=319348 RepID=A0A9J6C232_POLVA|nr:hypothetical protein PVAND_005446 [Polypedilum vanderplanki]
MKSVLLALIINNLIKYSITQSSNLFGCLITQPECPNSNISFYLYTRETQDNPMRLDLNEPTSVKNAKYAQHQPLIIIIHGYTGDKDYSPNSHLRPAYFQRGEFNIISVDYNELAKYPCYFSAVTNTRTVANCTAQLIDFIIDNEIFNIESIHVIGFSLGAQTAGLIANYLKSDRKLKRITGLDPAKPLFIRVGNEGRLDQSDAEFVDIIHTDVFDRGLLVPTGHADFFVNGGFNQPGCLQQTEMSASSCNHDRAPAYYAESINSDIGFWGYQCAHWYFYVLGLCNGDEYTSKAEMGFNTNNTVRGIYFLQVNSEPPYAQGKNHSNHDASLDGTNENSDF